MDTVLPLEAAFLLLEIPQLSQPTESSTKMLRHRQGLSDSPQVRWEVGSSGKLNSILLNLNPSLEKNLLLYSLHSFNI